MGTQLLQGQMEVQEQVLEYQYVKFFFVLSFFERFYWFKYICRC